MAAGPMCEWLESGLDGYSCRLRGVRLPAAEVNAKCASEDIAVMCVDAYRALFKAQEAIAENSTDAFLWLMESANQFENLQETDNAIMTLVKGIELATKNNLIDRGYDFFRYARGIYERGIATGDPTVRRPDIKPSLFRAGMSLIAAARKLKTEPDLTAMQAELKAALAGGLALKKAEKTGPRDVVVVDGRSLYERKAREYREGAEKYLASGMAKNGVTFACMAALAQLMLGRPKDGLMYLTELAARPDLKQYFQDSVCFQWTKLVFKALIERDRATIDEAAVLFLKIPWSFRDDREFARRVMESVERRLSSRP